MTTKQAFKQMITTPSIWKVLDVPVSRVLYFRNRLKYKKPIETDKMEELLLKAGYKPAQEKLWRFDSAQRPK